MKHLFLIVAASAGFLCASSLEAQTSNNGSTSTTTTATHRTTHATIAARNARLNQTMSQYQKAETTRITTPRVDGSVPRAVRSGNPLQMINPFAPAAYGDGHDVTRHDPDDPYQRAEGLKLVSIEF